jgi:hypothetical protein
MILAIDVLTAPKPGGASCYKAHHHRKDEHLGKTVVKWCRDKLWEKASRGYDRYLLCWQGMEHCMWNKRTQRIVAQEGSK